jgi:hypothetical protein
MAQCQQTFIWHPVSRAVGNVKNQGPELIEAIKDYRFDNVRNVAIDIVVGGHFNK